MESPRGILPTSSIFAPISPSGIILVSTSAFPDDSPITGLLVIILTTPACELAPKRVPCGPARTSIRAMSAA